MIEGVGRGDWCPALTCRARASCCRVGPAGSQTGNGPASPIEAWPVLISSNRELDPDTPSPAQFDHVITLVKLKDKTLWMDSTEEIAPVGVILPMLRNKQALAIPVGQPAYLVRTPADTAFCPDVALRHQRNHLRPGSLHCADRSELSR